MDPLSLTAVSAAVLTQGIGFLYGQVAELLRRRRERDQAGAVAPEVVEPATTGLDGRLAPGPVDEQALDEHAEQLARLKGLVSPYESGDLPVDSSNRQLLEQVDALRLLLEKIYGQRLTFQGEDRPPTGSPVSGQPGRAEQWVNQVIASGERSIAVAGNAHGTFVTGTVGEAGAHQRPLP